MDVFRQKISEGQVFFAALTVSELPPGEKKPSIYQADLTLASNGYRLETEQRTYVVKNEESRVFEAGQNRLIIAPYLAEDDDFAPARYLTTGMENDGFEKSITRQGKETVVKLKDLTGTGPFVKVEIRFDSNQMPSRLDAEDAWGRKVKVSFTKQSWMRENGWDSLTVQPGVEIVDLRQ